MVEPLLRVEGIGKHFSGLVALDDVSFSVNEGEIIGIIGPNGAGKSTLFNCIAGTYRPSAGRVFFDNAEITGAKPHVLAKSGLARTFQLMKPFGSMTTLENVVVPTLAHHRRVDVAERHARELLDRAGLGDWVERQAEDLSTAGRKRLELVRALALRPRLLLLDEVMSGLVPTERAPVLDLLREVRAQGVTLLFVEHVMSAVMSLSDRVVVLHNGRLLAEGDPQTISADPEVIQAYLGEG